MKPSIKCCIPVLICCFFGLAVVLCVVYYCFPLDFSRQKTNPLALSEGTEERLVALRGKLIQKLFPGPPEYSSVAKGDRADYCWILQLDSSSFFIAMTTPVGAPANDLSHIVKWPHPNEIFLALDEDMKNFCFEHINQEIVSEGHLFHAHTEHHYTPILMDVKRMLEKETHDFPLP